MNKRRAEQLVQKTRKDYNAIAAHFSSTRYRPWKEMREFTRYVQPGQKILDLGCGNGRLLSALPGNIIYTGLDLSDELIEQAKTKHLTHVAQPQFMTGDMRELPFSDESFHHVFLVSSLYHIPSRHDRHQVMQEVSRVLKPGGYVFMTNWDLRKVLFLVPWLKSLPKILLGRIGLFDFFYRWKDPKGTTLVHRYAHAFSLLETQRLLEQSGLKVVKIWKTRPGFFSKSRASNIVSIAQKKAQSQVMVAKKIPEPEVA